MTTPVAQAPGTLALRVPWATVAGAAAVAGLVTLRDLALPASELSTRSPKDSTAGRRTSRRAA